MAYLEIGSPAVTVYVVLGGRSSRDKKEVGDRERAFDGTMRETIRTRKRSWRVTTHPMIRSDANALETELESTPPLTCAGDFLGGTVSCHAKILNWASMMLAGSEHVVIEFELMEA